MQALTAAQMREWDARMIDEQGVPGFELMDRAGRGLATEIRRICTLRGARRPAIRMFAGKGNNGGDVFAAAYHLLADGYDQEIFLAASPSVLAGDARAHFARIAGQVPVHTLEHAQAWDALPGAAGSVDVVVDGLLGTGASGDPREPMASAIRALNRLGARSVVLAVDMPSGVHADSGVASRICVTADVTVTMGRPKVGLLEAVSLPYTGRVVVHDIGMPCSWTPRVRPGKPELLTDADVAAYLPRRARCSHKGDYGRVLVVGGAAGYVGAVSMALRSACLSGAGLVHALVPDSIAREVAVLVPEAMVHAAPSRSDGGLPSGALAAVAGQIRGFGAVLVGPGMTCHPDGKLLLQQVLEQVEAMVVLDADALTLLSEMPAPPQRAADRTILTPHPGEAGRLLGIDTRKIQQDREKAALALGVQYQAIAILKGAGTLVSDGKQLALNLTGNPGMATGGSGDVLAGLTAGLAAQGGRAFDAATAAVYLHGVAGDRAAMAGSQAGLTAMQILEAIPAAFRELLGR